ncbi:hypothetical protein B0H13DRAFT_1859332 [Mycena leptocephala]|nr:hypothetical protein B0H13DRAFT_1859332 [Mycena leptocephala]
MSARATMENKLRIFWNCCPFMSLGSRGSWETALVQQLRIPTVERRSLVRSGKQGAVPLVLRRAPGVRCQDGAKSLARSDKQGTANGRRSTPCFAKGSRRRDIRMVRAKSLAKSDKQGRAPRVLRRLLSAATSGWCKRKEGKSNIRTV